MSALVAAGCQPATVQQEFRVVERWSSRWCADETQLRADGCQFSQSINALAGAVGALRGGDGDSRPPLRIDAQTATRACLAADDRAIASLAPLLAEGARVVVRADALDRYTARTAGTGDGKAFHVVDCLYRYVLLEGPRAALDPGRAR